MQLFVWFVLWTRRQLIGRTQKEIRMQTYSTNECLQKMFSFLEANEIECVEYVPESPSWFPFSVKCSIFNWLYTARASLIITSFELNDLLLSPMPWSSSHSISLSSDECPGEFWYEPCIKMNRIYGLNMSSSQPCRSIITSSNRYSLISRSVNSFLAALDPNAASCSKIRQPRKNNYIFGQAHNGQWIFRTGLIRTFNLLSCSRTWRSNVWIRSNASSNDAKMVSFSITVVCSRFSSSFFVFVIMLSSSFRLSRPFTWFYMWFSDKNRQRNKWKCKEETH